MCLTYPAQVVSVADEAAIVEANGRQQRVLLLALEHNLPVPGDWLLVQSGIALSTLDGAEAAQRLRLLRQAEGVLK